MKTFGLFLVIWVIYVLIIFGLLEKASSVELSKFILATLFAFIFYKLLKEEEEL